MTSFDSRPSVLPVGGRLVVGGAAQISESDFFKNANERDRIPFLKAIVLRLRPMVCMKDDYVLQDGDTASEMYFIHRGIVEISRKGVRGGGHCCTPRILWRFVECCCVHLCAVACNRCACDVVLPAVRAGGSRRPHQWCVLRRGRSDRPATRRTGDRRRHAHQARRHATPKRRRSSAFFLLPVRAASQGLPRGKSMAMVVVSSSRARARGAAVSRCTAVCCRVGAGDERVPQHGGAAQEPAEAEKRHDDGALEHVEALACKVHVPRRRVHRGG